MFSQAGADWTVLLIGGPSSVGKSTAAKQIARRFGIPWLQVDDLRLALLASRVNLPTDDETRKLYFFDETPDLWRQPTERLRDGFVGVAEALAPALAKIITNHVATAEPIVVEGYGLLPSLPTRPDVVSYGSGGRVRAVFVIPPDADLILANMRSRGWGPPHLAEAELRTNAEAKWLYGQWVAEEARRLNVPVVSSLPPQTLAERILIAASLPPP